VSSPPNRPAEQGVNRDASSYDTCDIVFINIFIESTLRRHWKQRTALKRPVQPPCLNRPYSGDVTIDFVVP
jgi:hypothetical protein